eukprot:CAMPEP_0198202006 /NCGR_PEP_ID=MMETSP1445-20131203/5055_1 /TAXON_ID=36898 /ORGANISM="Pyramimonas sp., Strain CCMP2087" /LENGTH=261 /DNA_ID=CAMNT_0043872703 /DNA_START=287 /DNA_END=1072 /DNA_ORIENTATION=-
MQRISLGASSDRPAPRLRTLKLRHRREEKSRRGVSVVNAAQADKQATQRTEVEHLLKTFSTQKQLEGGVLKIRSLEGKDINNGVALLASAFESTLQSKPTVLVKKLLLQCLTEVPGGVCLVAELSSEGDPNDVEQTLVGIVALSFTPSTREADVPIPCPDSATYLSSMAVAANQRRRGIASHLLMACEELLQAIGGVDIWLHVQMEDQSARSLYTSAGYADQATEPTSFFFKNRPRKILMQKVLREGSNALTWANEEVPES